jgi:hypothetical protein
MSYVMSSSNVKKTRGKGSNIDVKKETQKKRLKKLAVQCQRVVRNLQITLFVEQRYFKKTFFVTCKSCY